MEGDRILKKILGCQCFEKPSSFLKEVGVTEKVKNAFNTTQRQVKIHFKLVPVSNLVNLLASVLQLIQQMPDSPSSILEQSYLSSFQAHVKNSDVEMIQKYQEFSLKLLRCCLQCIEGRSKSDVKHSVEICKIGLRSLEAITEDKNTPELWLNQSDRLTKLLFHLLVQMIKQELVEEFVFLSQKMLSFIRKNIQILSCTNGHTEQDIVSISKKVFDMHWTFATKLTKRTGIKTDFLDILTIKLQGILFLMETKTEFTMIVQYLETAFVSLASVPKDSATAELQNIILEVVKALVLRIFSSNVPTDVKRKSSLFYSVILCYTVLADFTNLSDLKDFTKVLNEIFDKYGEGLGKQLFSVLNRGLKVNCFMKSLMQRHVQKDLCKEEENVTAFLESLGDLLSNFQSSGILVSTIKIIDILRFAKNCMNSCISSCLTVLGGIRNFLNVCMKTIGRIVDSLSRQLVNGGNTKNKEAMKTTHGKIFPLWFSILIWMMKNYQAVLIGGETKQSKKSCQCKETSLLNRDSFQESCLLAAENISNLLKIASSNSIDVSPSEHQWIGSLLCNLGLQNMKDRNYSLAVKYFELGLQNLKCWIQLDNISPSKETFLTRIDQVKLLKCNSLLAETLLKANNFKSAFQKINDLTQFLLSCNLDTKSCNGLFKNLIDQWITIKEKIKLHKADRKLGSIPRTLSKQLEIDGTLPTEMLEMEYDAYKKHVTKKESWIQELEELCKLMMEFYEKQRDAVSLAGAVLEFASLPISRHDVEERHRICYEALQVLQELYSQTEKEKTERPFLQDLLATAYFQVGVLHYQIAINTTTTDGNFHELYDSVLMDRSNGINGAERDDSLVEEVGADTEEDTQDPKLAGTEFITSITAAVDIWTSLIQRLVNDKKRTLTVNDVFKVPERVTRYLLHAGCIYMLLRQDFNAIHSFHLSGLLSEFIYFMSMNTSIGFELQMKSWCLAIQMLSSWFDFSSAIELIDRLACLEDDLQLPLKFQYDLAKAYTLFKQGKHVDVVKMLQKMNENELLSKKTRVSLLLQVDFLMLCMHCQEQPCQPDEDFLKDHPLLTALDVLRILKNLVEFYFNPNCSEDNTSLTENYISAWIVVEKLLACLLHVSQLYKSQGCIAEAKNYLIEGLHLVEKFNLNQRRLEFLKEMFEIDQMAGETEKCCRYLEFYCQQLQRSLNSLGANVTTFDSTVVLSHASGCACDICYNPIILKACIQFLVLNARYGFLSNRTERTSNSEETFTELRDAIESAKRKSTRIMQETRKNIILTRPKSKSQKVTFEGQKPITCKDKRNEKVSDILRSVNDIADVMYFEEVVQGICLEVKHRITKKENLLGNDKILQAILTQVKESPFYPVYTTSFRNELLNIYCLLCEMSLASETGAQDVEARWCIQSATSSLKTELTANFRNGSKDSHVDKKSSKQKGRGKQTKEDDEIEICTKSSRRGKGKSARGKSTRGRNLKVVEKEINESEDEISHKFSSVLKIADAQPESILSYVQSLAREALSLSVPSLDSLLIKHICMLQSLSTGNTMPLNTASLELLSCAKTLQDRISLSVMKRTRKPKKDPEETKQATEEETRHSLDTDIFSYLQHFNNSSCLEPEEFQKLCIDSLPPDWRVCCLRLSDVGKKSIVAVRVQSNKKPIIIKLSLDEENEDWEDSSVSGLVRDLSSAFQTDPLEDMEDILEQSKQSMKIKDVKTWWNERVRLDKRLQRLLVKLENKWLGCWKGIVLGQRSEDDELQLDSLSDELAKLYNNQYNIEVNLDLLKALMDSCTHIDKVQLVSGLKALLGEHFCEDALEAFIEQADVLSTKDDSDEGNSKKRK